MSCVKVASLQALSADHFGIQRLGNELPLLSISHHDSIDDSFCDRSAGKGSEKR